MLSSGRANRLVVVDYGSAVEQVSNRLENRGLLLARRLEGLGLKADRIQVIEVPPGHPVTLGEAQIVLSILSKSGVRSAILLADGFHTRKALGSGLQYCNSKKLLKGWGRIFRCQ